MAKYYNAETLLEFVKQNTPHIEGETTMQYCGAKMDGKKEGTT